MLITDILNSKERSGIDEKKNYYYYLFVVTVTADEKGTKDTEDMIKIGDNKVPEEDHNDLVKRIAKLNTEISKNGR
ncbi:hypothetical protein BN1058_00312 [Paraliobacillus sp. PM-2]|uniref:hypothetical protein n=1 Tax=Paraliobacillus sp. PM-2 TaxID=1462524 RepID=UPI00061C9B3D|nr:hypothetical protein [Paraliobacillus sp. PM-2]CQR46067.1 hypothetical protein BN1058_00312 [Paraliobacillus sp. PM-2]